MTARALISTADHQDARPSASPSSSLWRWARIAVTLALLALVASRIDFRDLAAAFAAARPGPLLLLIAVIWAQRYLAAIRWWLLLRCNTPSLPLWSVVRVTFASDFIGQFLPGTVGVELLRLCGISRATGNTAAAVSSIVADRLLSTAALAALVLVALAAAPRTVQVDPSLAIAGWACLALAVAAGAAAMSPRARRAAERLLPRPLARRFQSRLDRVYTAFDQYRARRGLLALGVALALLFQSIRILMYFVGAVALGIDAPFSAFAVYIPIIIFLTLLPISIGGFGVREAAFMYLFAGVGVPGEQAVALSLFVYIVHMLCRLPGAWFCAVGPAAPRPAPSSTASACEKA